jgi:hypothetical protein
MITKFLVRSAVATGLIGAVVLGGSTPVNAAASKQQEIAQLQNRLGQLRLRLTETDGFYRAAQSRAQEALATVSVTETGAKAAKQAGVLLKIVSPIASAIVKGTATAVKTYDRVIASIYAGRWTTTKKELQTLINNLDTNRLDACAPYVREINTVSDRLRVLGVRNP